MGAFDLYENQTMQRVGDFTLGDIWETNNRGFDDNKGSTLLYVWTQKGADFLESIHSNIRIMNYPIEKSRGTERVHSLKIHPGREKLFKDAQELSAGQFFVKYAPYLMKVRMKNIGRFLLWRLGLQDIVRHVKHLVIHRK